MDDGFEKFVVENRAEFDQQAPSHLLWNQIESNLDQKNNYWPKVWKVAAVIFMISTAYLLVDQSGTWEPTATLPLEFQQAEEYYISQISERKQLIKDQLKESEEVKFLEEIEMLDSMYIELKKTYQTNASSDRVTDALINNLQLRAEILDRQLEVLRIIKNQKNENDLSIEI